VKKPLVAVVGRPNVGKSTLFNRMIRRREAIVDDEPGITRDRNDADTDWEGCTFTVEDTGGFITKGRDDIEKGVTRQVSIAVEEADLVLFMTDATTGITDIDSDVAKLLLRSKKPVILVVNKADHPVRAAGAAEFIRLGLGEPVVISASNGIGTGDLLSRIVQVLGLKPDQEEATAGEGAVRFAVVGRPNVGKSTFINALLGEERLLVTEIPGTTRDSVDVGISFGGERFVVIDTAGLRKKTRVEKGVEYYSTVRTRQTIERCDVACVMADAAEGVTQQDMGILGEAVQRRKGVLVAVNKWDLAQDDPEKSRQAKQSVDLRLQGLEYVPVLFISAKTGFRAVSVLETARAVARERKKRVASPAFNRFLENLNRKMQPPAVLGKRVRILYGAQVETDPPKFTLFCNYPELIKETYKKFTENQIREAFGFQGVPLMFSYRKS
jgi:GTP-binding protein